MNTCRGVKKTVSDVSDGEPSPESDTWSESEVIDRLYASYINIQIWIPESVATDGKAQAKPPSTLICSSLAYEWHRVCTERCGGEGKPT